MQTPKLFLIPAAVSLVACGAVAQGGPGDAGPDAHHLDGANQIEPGVDGGSSPGHARDGASAPGVDGGSSPGHPRDAGSVNSDGGSAPSSDGGSQQNDGSASPPVYVDAGLYHGDGSFFVDGGAYADVGTSGHGGTDASLGIDASPGCQSLGACCSSLSGAFQTLCLTVATSGNATSCSAELTQLQGGGDCMGVSVLASQIQLPASRLVSDGTTLFWTNYQQSAGLVAMPVDGGPVTTLLTGIVDLVYVDDVNVYVVMAPRITSFGDNDLATYLMDNASLVRIPKNGTAATRMSDPGASVWAATVLGGTAYWLESTASFGVADVRSTALQGGPVVPILHLSNNVQQGLTWLGVTDTTVFLTGSTSVGYFPLVGTTGVDPGPAVSCFSLTSDTSAVYCDVGTGTNLRIASDGTTTQLGSAVGPSPIDEFPYIVFDDTFAYWVDNASAGTIMKAPKAGGGTATVLARDTSPTAIAVDANSVYWSDQAGYIKSVPK